MSQLPPHQVPPQYPPHLPYYAPAPMPPTVPPKRRFGVGLIGWILFFGLSIMLFLLLSQRSDTARRYRSISLSEFATRLDANEVRSVVVEGDRIEGQFVRPPSTTDGAAFYRCELPQGVAESWPFMEWLLAHRGGAEVSARNANSYVINILLPVVPWLLIFAFIWFFVFRQLRKAGKNQSVVITGPGRWVPDPPSPTTPS
jgi:cell division protease FtsH